MVHKSSLQSRTLLLPIVAMALFLSAIMSSVTAQVAPSSLTVTPDPTQNVVSGEPVTFTLAYGFPDAYEFARPIEIVVEWTNATFLDSTGGPEPDVGDTQVTWTYEPGSLNPAALPTFTLTAGDAPGPIEVKGTISSPEQPDDALRSIEGTISVEILDAPLIEPTDIPQEADLSTSTLVLDPTDTVMAGSPISITVTVRNTGSTAAVSVIVTLESDPRLQYLFLAPPLLALPSTPAVEGGLSYRVMGAVEPGAEVSVRLSGIVAPYASGDLQVNGLITTPEGVEVPVDDTVQVQPTPPRLAVEIEGPDSAVTGEALSFLLKVSNIGSVPAENVKVDVTTSPAFNLEVVDDGSMSSTQGADNRLLLEFPSIAPDDMVAVTLTGDAPVGSGSLSVDVAVQDSEGFDEQSILTTSRPVPLTPPPPTATVESVATQPPPTVEPGPSSTPTLEAAPADTPPPPETGITSLLVVGAGALLAAIIAGVVLFLLLRGRRKPTPPPPVTVKDPGQPGPVPPLPPLPAGAVLESLSIPGRRLRLGDGTTTIGRALDSTICINERFMNWETVSRRHAEIRREGDYYVIYDVSKRNGVYVNGMRTARNVLRPECRVGIGGVEFVFHTVAAADQ